MGVPKNVRTQVSRKSGASTQSSALDGCIGRWPSATEHEALGKELFIRQGVVGNREDLIKRGVTDAKNIQGGEGHARGLSLLPAQ